MFWFTTFYKNCQIIQDFQFNLVRSAYLWKVLPNIKHILYVLQILYEKILSWKLIKRIHSKLLAAKFYNSWDFTPNINSNWITKSAAAVNFIARGEKFSTKVIVNSLLLKRNEIGGFNRSKISLQKKNKWFLLNCEQTISSKKKKIYNCILTSL